jgi:hypothetical protein
MGLDEIIGLIGGSASYIIVLVALLGLASVIDFIHSSQAPFTDKRRSLIHHVIFDSNS